MTHGGGRGRRMVLPLLLAVLLLGAAPLSAPDDGPSFSLSTAGADRTVTAAGATGADEPGAHGGFSAVSGNPWWVQVVVETDHASIRVDASLDGRDWWPLRTQPWGGWGAARHVPDGSVLRFRATSSTGSVLHSACYQWPSAAEVECVPSASTADVRPPVTQQPTPTPPTTPAATPSPPPPPPPTLPPPPAPAPVGTAMRYVVLGDTGTSGATRRNIEGSLSDGAMGIIGTGDYWYNDQPDNWTRMFAPLLERGAWLVLGNHDAETPLRPYLPQTTWWSAHVGGARIVGLDSTKPMAPGTPQHAFARDALCEAEEPLRILVAHHNWWLLAEARHPGTEFPAPAEEMERLVSECGVDLVLAGHEHNYQRMMRGSVAYVILGTGGQSLYPAQGGPEGTVFAVAEYGRLLLDLSSSGYSGRFVTLENDTRDTFRGRSDAVHEAPPSPPFAFDHRGGGEYWVEVAVTPTPTAVEAMAEGGEWRRLEARSWGTWAASFRIEEGERVRFRAMAGGAWSESCWFSHPGGDPACGDVAAGRRSSS